MITKTTTATIIIAIFSLVGLALPAGVSQTAFAQTIADEAVGGTLLEGFFDDESNEEEAGDTESQGIDQEQQQDQDQEQQQDQEISQDESATQGNNAEAGDNTGTIGQNIEGNAVEGADCGDALICFGNDIVNDAEQDQDASVHDVSETNTATFGADDADNIGIQDQDQDQDADQRAANFRLDFELDEQCFNEASADAAAAAAADVATSTEIGIGVAAADAAPGGSASAVQDCLFDESSQSQTNEETTTEAPENGIL